MHTRNIMRSRGYESGDEGAETLRQRCRENFITRTRESIADQLREASLPPQKVYIVSCSRWFREEYSAFTADSEQSADPIGGSAQFVDERMLIEDLLRAAGNRRCDIDSSPRKQLRKRYHKQVSILRPFILINPTH